MHLSAPIFRLKRRARLLARDVGIPLHDALDRVARAEGFNGWSHLAARSDSTLPARQLIRAFSPGDLGLMAARPGHGKTLLGLGILAEAVRDGRHGFFFTLDYCESDVDARLRGLAEGKTPRRNRLVIDTSDDICADYVLDRIAGAAPGAVVVIDYLQVLDQKRSHPELAHQVRRLREGAARRGAIILTISQIDRNHEATGKPMPGLADIRLPNPVDLNLLTKACFLQDGEIALRDVA